MVPFNGAILWHVCTRHKIPSDATPTSMKNENVQQIFNVFNLRLHIQNLLFVSNYVLHSANFI